MMIQTSLSAPADIEPVSYTHLQTMEWTVERENGRAVYKFDMTTGGDKKAEVKVDGMNGKVLSAKVKNTKY